LWEWEEELLEECRLLLNNFVLQTDVTDRWQWLPDIAGGYTVRGAYQILTTQVAPLRDETRDLVWHKQVPLKVSILAWRLLRDRLPTKQNLLRRGIIQSADTHYVAGCGNNESLLYMFIHYDIFGALWQHVRSWLGISGVDPYNIHAHFIQFTNAIGTSRSRHSFMQLLWLLCVCVNIMEQKKQQIIQ